jgi:hypothetical protein
MSDKELIEKIREICLEVGKEARDAAKKPDVALYDSESYIAGYQDCAVDIDNVIMAYLSAVN